MLSFDPSSHDTIAWILEAGWLSTILRSSFLVLWRKSAIMINKIAFLNGSPTRRGGDSRPRDGLEGGQYG